MLVDFKYQTIHTKGRLDVVNLVDYDMILGTPFCFQHRVVIGLNPTRISIGSNIPLPIRGPEVTSISSAAADIVEDQLQRLREQLKQEAMDLCPDTEHTSLPPMRAINHTIPLIDESKVYSYRPAKCPEAMKDMWREKKQAYLTSGRWRTATGSNPMPLLIIPKPPKADGKLRMRTVVDKRQQNANMKHLAAPLPDIEAILRKVARHPFRSLIGGKDAYEQIHVIPEHVDCTLFNTPDGTMESLVLQQGDCNGPTTYQTLMNHIFAPYIGAFMDVYLDDIVIYSDTIEDHLYGASSFI